MKIIYQVYSKNNPPLSREVDVDFDSIEKGVLLNIYYSNMMKMRAKAADVITHIGNQAWWTCYYNETPVTRSHYMVNVPLFEIMRMMASIYGKDLIKTEEQDGECYVFLSDMGFDKCQEYLCES